MASVESRDKWMVIYPVYINSKKSTAQGRRLSVERSVESPSPKEVYEALAKMGYKVEGEDKAYSRDYMQRGRVRVMFKNADGKPVMKDIHNKRALLIRVAAMINKNPNRKPAADPAAIPAGIAGGAAAAPAKAQAKASAPAKSSKKKGKKK
eukprot:GFYU01013267.1.p1 GENE.GFYU01013267.1~~GFYU01013267.1.p1  ORF type:complete len:151 (+),score=53.02 GFYU01013267.1:112-564(+)